MCKDTNLALSIAKNAHNYVGKVIEQQNLFILLKCQIYPLFQILMSYSQADQIFVPAIYSLTHKFVAMAHWDNHINV